MGFFVSGIFVLVPNIIGRLCVTTVCWWSLKLVIIIRQNKIKKISGAMTFFTWIFTIFGNLSYDLWFMKFYKIYDLWWSLAAWALVTRSCIRNCYVSCCSLWTWKFNCSYLFEHKCFMFNYIMLIYRLRICCFGYV